MGKEFFDLIRKLLEEERDRQKIGKKQWCIECQSRIVDFLEKKLSEELEPTKEETMNKLTKKYKEIFKELVEEFVDKYFTYDDESKSDYCIIGESLNLCWDVVYIESEDMYRSINNIREALHNEIPKKTLTDWYYYRVDEGGKTNLVSYHRGAPKYTKQDKERGKEKIRSIYESLRKQAKKDFGVILEENIDVFLMRKEK